MSSNILPSEICRGPRWELAVKREMSLSELKMLAMANSASAIRVGCHISHSSLGRDELYCKRKAYSSTYFINPSFTGLEKFFSSS